MATTIYISDDLLTQARSYNINISKITREAIHLEIQKRQGTIITHTTLDELKRLKEIEEYKAKQAAEKYSNLLNKLRVMEERKISWEDDRNKLLSLIKQGYDLHSDIIKNYLITMGFKYNMTPKQFWDECHKTT